MSWVCPKSLNCSENDLRDARTFCMVLNSARTLIVGFCTYFKYSKTELFWAPTHQFVHAMLNVTLTPMSLLCCQLSKADLVCLDREVRYLEIFRVPRNRLDRIKRMIPRH